MDTLTLKVGVIIARFQPLLRSQIENVINPAIKNSDLTVMLLGSSGCARNCVNPLTSSDREEMIKQSLIDYKLRYSGVSYGGKSTLVFDSIRDFFYSETPVDWITQVQKAVSISIKKHIPITVSKRVNIEITLYGAESDKFSKDFHNWFPQWKVNLTNVESLDEIDSCPMDSIFNRDSDMVSEGDVTQETFDFLMNWLDTKEGKRLAEEHFYVQEYKQRTQTGKHPIIFQTVDNVCYYKGNVLLVKRRSQPGKGLWALPGGFLEHNELCKDGAVRELLEETRLRVKPEWLISRDTFDHPNRSVRGRTITNAFLWKIPDSREVPQIKAGSDASRAKWFPLAEVLGDMSDQLFEDHLDIITTLTKRL